MFALVFIEWEIIARQNKERYEAKDFWASTAIGVGNILVSSVTKLSIFGLILFFYNAMVHSLYVVVVSAVFCVS